MRAAPLVRRLASLDVRARICRPHLQDRQWALNRPEAKQLLAAAASGDEQAIRRVLGDWSGHERKRALQSIVENLAKRGLDEQLQLLLSEVERQDVDIGQTARIARLVSSLKTRDQHTLLDDLREREMAGAELTGQTFAILMNSYGSKHMGAEVELLYAEARRRRALERAVFNSLMADRLRRENFEGVTYAFVDLLHYDVPPDRTAYGLVMRALYDNFHPLRFRLTRTKLLSHFGLEWGHVPMHDIIQNDVGGFDVQQSKPASGTPTPPEEVQGRAVIEAFCNRLGRSLLKAKRKRRNFLQFCSGVLREGIPLDSELCDQILILRAREGSVHQCRQVMSAALSAGVKPSLRRLRRREATALTEKLNAPSHASSRPVKRAFEAYSEALFKSGEYEEVIKLRTALPQFGLQPSGKLLVHQLHAYGQFENAKDALACIEQLESSGYRMHSSVAFNPLLRAYLLRKRNIKFGQKVFDAMTRMEVPLANSTYSLLLEALAKAGMIDEMEQLYAGIQKSKMLSTSDCAVVVRTYVERGDLEKAWETASSFADDEHLNREMQMAYYGYVGDVKGGLAELKDLEHTLKRRFILALASRLCERNHAAGAWKVLSELRRNRDKLESRHVLPVLEAARRTGDVELISQISEYVRPLEYKDLQRSVSDALAEAAFAKGDYARVVSIHESERKESARLSSRKLVVFLQSLNKLKRWHEAIELFEEARTVHVPLNSGAWMAYVYALSCTPSNRSRALGMVLGTEQNLRFLERISQSVIRSMVYDSEPSVAMNVLEHIRSRGILPSETVYRLALRAGAQSGNKGAVARVLSMVKSDGLRLTPATMAVVIHSMNVGGVAPEDFLAMFSSMCSHGVFPDDRCIEMLERLYVEQGQLPILAALRQAKEIHHSRGGV